MQTINPYNRPDCISVPTLNDVDLMSPFRAMWGTATADLMQQAISNVMGRIKWNKLRCWVPFSCVFNRPEIESIIISYYNMAKKKQIPEYRDKSPDAQKVINEVAKVSLRSKEQTQLVLNYLYWGSIDGSNDVSQKISLPISSEYKKEEREVPEEYKMGTIEGVLDKVGGGVATAFDILKWGLIIGGVGVGAYALTQLNTTAKILGKGK